MSFLNLGILAHVDAGKTSLTERLLFDAGVIDRLGSVDSGDTSTDTLDQERRRGITIRSAVATFTINALTVNLIDTPGHPDFIAEVERALRVLDGAILVVSAVEGVQAQTRILLNTLRRMRVPTLVFVNKTDRAGADPDRVLRDIPDAIATWVDYAEALAERDEQALAAFATDQPTPPGTLERLTASAEVLPAFRGSAITGDGIPALTRAIAELLPSAVGNATAPLRATAFKVEADRTALIRVHDGTLRVRDRIGDEQVVAIDSGDRDCIAAGDIGRVRGLRSIRVGDALGGGDHLPAVFPPPTHESTIKPADPRRRADLHRALSTLAEQDPLIDLRLDPGSGELSVRLYGEVQKEVIRDTLAEDFGIDVHFGDTVTLLREKPAGSATVGLDLWQRGNPYSAGLHLLVEPGDGIDVRLTAPARNIPLRLYHSAAEFRDALDGYARASLSRGGVRRWDVDGICITITDCGWFPPVTTAAHFRRLLHELLHRALTETGTIMCEPVHDIQVTCPADTSSAVLSSAARSNTTIAGISINGPTAIIDGAIPAARLRGFEVSLPGLTRGEARYEVGAIDWRPVTA